MNEFENGTIEQNTDMQPEAEQISRPRMQEAVSKTEITKSFLTGLFIGLAVSLLISSSMYLYSRFSYKKAANIGEKQDTVLTDRVDAKLHVLEDSIQQYYLGDIDYDHMSESLYKGLVDGLDDKYSTYYTAEELEQVRADSEGVFYGIGASITIDADTTYAKIAKVLKNTPAEEAGLKDGDIIVAVEDESTAGLTLQDVVKRIKGEENTEVHLTIVREGEYDTLDFTITRKAIESETVTNEFDERTKIATIRINEFDLVTPKQFEEAMGESKDKGMKALILDLRDNPGGNLSAVVDIARMLLPKGLIVYTEDKNGARDEYSCDGDNEIDVPMVVLVNENSASAAEILAGAIKDYDKGFLLGKTTFGKGIVQKIFGMTDGSAVKLTISHYYTPNGNDIHKVGIKPDEDLDLDVEKYVEKGYDNQWERAKQILKGKIK